MLPDGPRAGFRFSAAFMPWTGLVLTAFDDPRYRRFWGSGPAQSSKTVLFFLIPILYHLFEVRESIIVGVPRMEDAYGIWADRILPAIRANPAWAALLPSEGAGSRGGRFHSVRLKSGAALRFMSGAGRDEERSGYPARVVVFTEVDKFDEAGDASKESDPITQIETRTEAYGDRALVFAECTMSTKEGRVWREVSDHGTGSQLWLACPHCGRWAAPEREQFVGWQGAEDVNAARELGAYACAECGVAWSEADRRAALEHPLLVAEGQTVTAGLVTGEPRRTNTFGVRWNSLHSALTGMANIAEKEWRAAIDDDESSKKRLAQFVWGLPYEAEKEQTIDITEQTMYRRITDRARGIVPAGTEKVTVFIDLGLYRCWWSAWAWSEGMRGHCLDYGCLLVEHGARSEDAAILAALREFRDDILIPGWANAEGVRRGADMVLVDRNWKSEVVSVFCRESGQGYMGAHGRGNVRGLKSWTEPNPTKAKLIGEGWYVTPSSRGGCVVLMDSDRWKGRVHSGFVASEGGPGALTLYKGQPREHSTFCRHILAEHQIEEWEPGKGPIVRWHQSSRSNHYLDTAYGAMVAASICGMRLVAPAKIPRRPKLGGGYQHQQGPYQRSAAGGGWRIGR